MLSSSEQRSLFWFVLARQRQEIERALQLLKVHNEGIEKQLRKENDEFAKW
jgi:hypothetical protein